MSEDGLEIDKSVLHKTTDCIFDFTCLSGDKSCLCDVVMSNEEDIVELKSKPSVACKYSISLVSASYCTCLTRVEIYNRYRM